MSAGGISYSAIVNSGKITLPSVEAGLGSMNMLRDPPKSYHTSRKNKVGETSSITEMIDESGNRSCEAIQVYAEELIHAYQFHIPITETTVGSKLQVV